MLTFFKIGESIGQISGLNITVKLAVDENSIKSLIADFEGDDLINVVVGTSIQVSGETSNDFSIPLTYSVTDISGTSDYTVTVLNTENKVKDINFPEILCNIQISDSDNTIKVVCPESIPVNNLLVNIYTSYKSTCNITLNSNIDLTSDITVTVTSESGNINNYTLTIVRATVHNYYGSAIFKMLLNRLPFIDDTPQNRDIVSELTYEIMFENEDCFNITDKDNSRIGNEMFYNTLHKSIIADILAINLLINKSLKTVGGEASTNTLPNDRFIKTVEAGSVKVGYDQISIKDKTVIALDTVTLISKFESEVSRKMTKLGCYYGEVEPDTSVPYVGFITSGRAKNIF